MIYRLLLSAFMVTAMTQSLPAIQTSSSSTPAQAQESPAAKQSPASAAAQVNNAAPAATDAVITLHGLCGTPARGGKAGACETVVNKQQFDAVVNALNAIGAPLLPSQYRTVAEGYSTTLVNYEAARKAGVERDPRFAEVMRLARMRAMGDMYNAMMQEKARKVSPAEIQAYYKNNAGKLEELTLRRIVLPKVNSANLKDEEFTAKARKLADEVHDRAARGEDLDALEKEAFATLGVKDPPTTKMGPVRRGLYATEQEQQLFALTAGEVTRIIEQPSTFLIFKLEDRKIPALEEAREEIVRKLIQEHLEKQQQAVKNGIQVEFNEQYVGIAGPPGSIPLGQLKAQSTNTSASGSKMVPPKSGSSR
jgi:parvulin-like peptidyl-prolyl cis-trans isomerase-like protein